MKMDFQLGKEFVVVDCVSGDDSDVICEDDPSEKDCNCHIKIKELQAKVMKLTKQLEVLKDNTKEGFPRPPVEIIFSDQNSSLKYRPRVEKFLQGLLSSSDFMENNKELSDEQNPQSIQVFKGFCLDKQDFSSDIKSPLYPPSNNLHILNGTIKPANDPKENTGMCFNCLGNHVIKDCPFPIDRDKVSKNKAKRASTNISSNRYHLDEGSLNNFKPGVISQELRDALDLGPRDIPMYIYTMRILGYPPGWLQEAEIDDSNLKLYHSHKDHENERDSTDSCQPVRYDPKKIINIPGFNQKLNYNMKDDYEKLGYPPIQHNHLKENMREINSFTDHHSKHHKRKHRHDSSDRSKIQRVEDVSDQDMEIVIEDEIASPDKSGDDIASPDKSDNEIASLDKSGNEIASPDQSDNEIKSACSQEENTNSNLSESRHSSKSVFNKEISAISSRSESPTLSDLETARNKLLTQLQDNIETSQDVSQDSISSKDGNSQTQESLTHTGLSLTIESGSPSIASISGVNKLPNREKFADGIGEHLPFENLQDSVGSFDKMRKVLSSVRRQLKPL